MTRSGSWVTVIGACVVIWNECGENPALFCYRIGLSAFTSVRAHGGFATAAMNPIARASIRCSNPFGIFSTRSTMLKD
jgi:hypothetical protein